MRERSSSGRPPVPVTSYTTTKNKDDAREDGDQKYDPKARKHVAYKEVKLKFGPPPEKPARVLLRRVFCPARVGDVRS